MCPYMLIPTNAPNYVYTYKCTHICLYLQICHAQIKRLFVLIPVVHLNIYFQIPNTRSIELESGARGCSALSFSADGRRLAVGVAGQTTSTIRVYDIPSGILVIQLEQLYGLVYEISFHEVILRVYLKNAGQRKLGYNNWLR